jgi:hypothetical protein
MGDEVLRAMNINLFRIIVKMYLDVCWRQGKARKQHLCV